MTDWDDEPIGYGRPPKWARYKKGQSGNYKGRPRKEQAQSNGAVGLEIDGVLLDLIKQKVRVSENGQILNLPAINALMKAHLSSALGGNVAAQRDFIRNIVEAEVRRAQVECREQTVAAEKEAKAAQEQQQLYTHYVRLKEKRSADWEAARQAGRDEPDFPWPHPDDILLDHAHRQFRIRGPICCKDVPNYLRHMALRDLFLVKMVLHSLERERSSEAMANIFNRLWVVQDHLLPKRWQIIGAREDAEMERLFAMPVVQLRRLVAEREQAVTAWECKLQTYSTGKASYRFTNELLRPHLKANGYKSLKQFELAFADTHGNPPWPRRRSG